ncbi:xanthine phosphoribosyltransferase [Phototrophicus methaneseepsis]|uniref:Xanthine phosphoribosyltransferase n=2 Tax=Phototrophicus methaneseepsis TaxID=2710758 RepID=A0A7S8EDS3_9CHLR|nr:xanthine phosphoribosyltransferase [Phototrophicus methaneseepsis]
MDELKARIQAEGRNLGRGILKIDSLLNHQLDPGLMRRMGQNMANHFKELDLQIDRILTAEISGIAPALMTAAELDVPVVYARKKRPITMSGPIFMEVAPSHTKGGDVTLMVSSEFLHAGENILIVDDFLATGHTLMALARMVRDAQANLVGVGVVVEKTFEEGRNAMLAAGYDIPIYALAAITSMDGEDIEMG